jgi:crotonobetainyl-CoA:carnitine CoA-transferase CaiB-like acyl-CoA transferase
MTDTANAMLSVVGCLAALYNQRRTGTGHELWTSLLDGAAMLASDAMLADGDEVPRPRLDADQCGIDACYRLYRTNEGWIQIAAVRDENFAALCHALGVPDLASDARFVDAAARAEHRQQLESLLAPRFMHRTAIVWSRVLDDAGVPNEVARDTYSGQTVLFDSDNERLGLVAEYEHPIVGRMRQFGSLIDFSETPGRIAGPPPLVGQETQAILAWLGYDDEQMQSLRDEGTVYWPDDDYAWTV